MRRFHLLRSVNFRLVMMLSLGITVASMAVHLAAQPPTKKPPFEEEEAPNKQKPRKPPPRVVDDEPTPAKPADKRTAQTIAVLVETAKQPDVPKEIRGLFDRLKMPFDRITLAGREKIVGPIAPYLGSGGSDPKTISIQFLELDKGTLAAPHSVPRAEINGVEYYEKIVLERAKEFLQGSRLSEGPEARTPTGRLQKLQAAEKLLAAVVRFHESARESGQREGAGWDGLRTRLSEQLLAVQIEELNVLAELANWADAFALADRLKVYREPKTQMELAKPLAKLVEQSFKSGDFREVNLRRKALEDLFPNTSVTEPIKQKLQKEAAARLERAKSEKDSAKAHELLNQADQIWRTEESRIFRGELRKGTPAILGVGVSELPELVSPGFAQTDSEKLAVDLLFESLLKPIVDPVFGQVYEPGLAIGRPQVVSLGREFKLGADAYWSDGSRVTAMDVKGTTELLRKPGWPGYQFSWSQLAGEPPPVTDISQVSVTLQQGYLAPLSLMTFKILPAPSGIAVQPDKADFARQPISSGPYRYEGWKEDKSNGEKYAQFSANPFYHRYGKGDQPFIREVRMFRSKDPVTDMNIGRLHLYLNPSADDVSRFNSLGNAQVLALPNRRICFLAINHRDPALQKLELRKALAHAIDRKTILNDRFRAGLKLETVPHRTLNGPYPPGSWACAKKLRAELYEKGLASQFKSPGPATILTLKYPDNDPRIEKACEDIRDQVAKNAGINLQLLARSPRQLATEVEGDFDYQLAYYHFDYGSDAYWLWPMFNPERQALEPYGGNFLGYHNDGALVKKFRLAMNHREFSKVQEYTREIHELLYEKMPFIPLWQLDTLVVLNQDLKPVGLEPKRVDPLHLLSNVEEWKLENK
jgi:ABC-type transport system substrate-binding protein